MGRSLLSTALPYLATVDRLRIEAAIKDASDDHLLSRLCFDSFERPNRICLTYHFPSDVPLQVYQSQQNLNDPWARDQSVPDGHVAVGCIWTSLHIGTDLAAFEATAATGEMSRLFAASSSIKTTFCTLAANSEADAAIFDDESNEHSMQQLWPATRLISRVEVPFPLEGARLDEYLKKLHTAAAARTSS